MTPEGKVKKRVKDLLSEYGADMYSHWPVINGMGAPSLDMIGCFKGRFIAVETKAGTKAFTERQKITAERIMSAGGKVILVNDVSGFDDLKEWLESVNSQGNEKHSPPSKESK